MNERNLVHERRQIHGRRGASWLGVTSVLVVIAGTALGAGWYLTSGNGLSSAPQNVLVHTVSRKPFTNVITVKGEVESSSNVDVRCLVKSQNSSGTAILWIVPEGTYVQPGDKLVELDSSALESERTAQQIVVNTSMALLIQSKNVYETAQIAKTEYENGTFTQEKKTITGEIFTAEENLRRAEEYLIYSKELYAKDFYTESLLKADEFAVDEAKNALELAENKLYVLENYTKEMMLKTLEANIQTAKAKLDSDEKSHRLDLQRLEEIELQIAHCVIYAEAAGQVVYANEDDWRNDDVVIEEGTMVRERQVIIRLPDPAKMQVKSKVHEAHVKLVQTGMSGTIRIDAFPDATLTGTVTRVSEMPDSSGGWRRGNVREYPTFVTIDNPLPGLRPGMSAEVNIVVEQSADELQVPVQAVVEHGNKYYCLLRDGAGFETREVLIASSNEKFIIIRDGLRPDEKVLMSPRTYLSEVELPAVPRQQVIVGQRDARPGDDADQTNSAGGAPSSVAGDASGDNEANGAQPPNSTDIVSSMIQENDGDADGKLSREELPADMQDRFQDSDADGDGFLDSRELVAMLNGGGAPSFVGGGAGQ